MSSDKPIEDSIILNFYPYTYKSNVGEILTLLKVNGLMGDERCNDALKILKKKREGKKKAEAQAAPAPKPAADVPVKQ